MTVVRFNFAAGSLQTDATSPTTMLSSTLRDGHRTCPGDKVIFNCVTNGSASHAWRSDEYIGQGGIQLEFASYDSQGFIRSNPASNIGTFATLIAIENRTQGIIRSQLEITVTSDYPNATISCLHVDTGSSNTTAFQLLGTFISGHMTFSQSDALKSVL